MTDTCTSSFRTTFIAASVTMLFSTYTDKTPFPYPATRCFIYVLIFYHARYKLMHFLFFSVNNMFSAIIFTNKPSSDVSCSFQCRFNQETHGLPSSFVVSSSLLKSFRVIVHFSQCFYSRVVFSSLRVLRPRLARIHQYEWHAIPCSSFVRLDIIY